MAITTTWTEQHLATLEAAYASGITEVSFGDRRVRYASLAELLQAIYALRAALSGVTAGAPRSRIVRVMTDKGF